MQNLINELTTTMYYYSGNVAAKDVNRDPLQNFSVMSEVMNCGSRYNFDHIEETDSTVRGVCVIDDEYNIVEVAELIGESSANIFNQRPHDFIGEAFNEYAIFTFVTEDQDGNVVGDRQHVFIYSKNQARIEFEDPDLEAA